MKRPKEPHTKAATKQPDAAATCKHCGAPMSADHTCPGLQKALEGAKAKEEASGNVSGNVSAKSAKLPAGDPAEKLPLKSLKPQTPTSSSQELTKLSGGKPEISPEEGLKKFSELDRQIREGVSGALKASIALHEMDEGEYWKFGVSVKTGKPFKTIAEYGAEVMARAESTVYQYVNAGRVAKLLNDSTYVEFKPSNEMQLRPLLDLRDKNQIIESWNKAEVLGGEGGITARIVRKAREMIAPVIREAKTVNAAKETLNYCEAGRRLWDKLTPQEKLMFLGEVNSWHRALLQEFKAEHPSIKTTAESTSERQSVRTVPPPAAFAKATVPLPPPDKPAAMPAAIHAGLRQRLISQKTVDKQPPPPGKAADRARHQ